MFKSSNNSNQLKCYETHKKAKCEAGFSIIELLIVMLIISILSVLAVLSFRTEKKYAADSTAYQVLDMLNEARQRSLTQRETMRIEFNQTRNKVRLINENDPSTTKDDKEIKVIDLPNQKDVVIGSAPKNAYKSPTEMSPTPALVYKKSVYPLSAGDMVATLRYTKTGMVFDAGSNAIGDNSTMTGATIFSWMPDSSSDTGQSSQQNASIIRAITVQGTSGLAKYWKCPVTNDGCQDWVQ